jgi:hypothetical protein
VRHQENKREGNDNVAAVTFFVALQHSKKKKGDLAALQHNNKKKKGDFDALQRDNKKRKKKVTVAGLPSPFSLRYSASAQCSKKKRRRH